MEKSTRGRPEPAAAAEVKPLAASLWAAGFDCGRSAAFREIVTYLIGLLIGFMVARLLFLEVRP